MSIFHKPKLPADRTPFWDLVRYIVDWCASERVVQIKGFKERQTAEGKFFVPDFVASSAASGFVGEYDEAKTYSAGQTFKISATNPFLIGLTVKAGFYAVRPPIASDSLGYGPFAGNLPANPIATAGIDSKLAFFDPDNNGAPAFGVSPNDKIYAEIINQFC